MSEVTDPRQVVLVSSREEMDVMGKKKLKDNIITLAWHMPVSFNPNLYAIAIGKTRFSCEIIKKSKVFVVNFMPFSLKEAAVFCGTKSGMHIDKFKEAGLGKEDCRNVDCPRIKEALAYIECKVVDEVDAGDHIIFIGQVLNSEFKKSGKRLLQMGRGFTTSAD
ncbi:MAG: flavin reductase family protein [Nanoarchaeota archaeon]|nr:flavin reductase family protein [Nanoarchaeota archaeon]MBU1005807.1 flavin reductase family protein [Nanoarchaeota archaeon]MBU1945428.1 flavin reductase family protein [Nanoarchaeota archaeon]